MLVLVALVVACTVTLDLAVFVVVRVASWRSLVHKRVLVVLAGERTIDGILWARRGDLLVLRDAKVYAGTTNPVPADGELVIERARVEWMQVLS